MYRSHVDKMKTIEKKTHGLIYTIRCSCIRISNNGKKQPTTIPGLQAPCSLTCGKLNTNKMMLDESPTTLHPCRNV